MSLSSSVVARTCTLLVPGNLDLMYRHSQPPTWSSVHQAGPCAGRRGHGGRRDAGSVGERECFFCRTPTVLSPPDAGRLSQADIVFWIGPNFENFLGAPLGALASKAKVVALDGRASDIVVRRARETGVWEPHKPDEPVAPDTNVPAQEIDGHIWLDPMNAKAMVAAITKTLVEADPANAARYSTNASALATRLDGLDTDIARTVAPVKAMPFVVFHGRVSVFPGPLRRERAVGAITVSPDRPPGARRVAAVKDKIAGLGAVCVFAEPQFEPNLIHMLVAGTRAKTDVLDPEGTTLEAGPDLYFVLMRGIADHLAACLGSRT